MVVRSAAACAVLMLAGIAGAQAGQPDLWDGQWHYSITPYGWLPGISLTTRYQSSSGTVQNQTNDGIYSYLSGAFMLAGEARKGNWGVYTDLDWVDFSNEKGRMTAVGGSRVGANLELDTRWDLEGGLVNLDGIRSLAHGSHGYIDLVFGVRYLKIHGDLNWDASATGNAGQAGLERSGHASGHAHFVDAIVGLKGAWTPFQRSRIFFPYYVDVGAGDSVTTYQIMAGVAYRFDWGNIALRYRELEYRRSGDKQFLQRARLSGPTVSATWVF